MIVALESLLTVVVETLNVPVATPAATVMEAGTVKTALVLVSVTKAPPAGAAFVNVTVQVLDPFAPKLLGLHPNDDTSTGATRFTVVLAELLLYVAVTVAPWSLGMAPVSVALKVAVVCPANTVTEPGTGSSALLLDKVTEAPPVGAAPDNVTVQVVPAPPLNDDGLQLTDETVGSAAPPVTTPAVPGTPVPVATLVAANPPVTLNVVLVNPTPITRFTTATVPFEIVLAFMPVARQVYAPNPVSAQFSVLPALVAESPGAAEIETTFNAG